MDANYLKLPDNLPAPVDDGAASHLLNSSLPDVTLPTTDGTSVNLQALTGRWVLYIYPMTGRPNVPLPDGWNEIPGARGCTPQSCGFRDHFQELQKYDARVFGLSSQTTAYQQEVRDRLHLPFQLLCDQDLQLKRLLRLPTFTVAGTELFKRLTLVVAGGRIAKVFYPVFPPDQNAGEVLSWLRLNVPPSGAAH